jgi:hypothetical protein
LLLIQSSSRKRILCFTQLDYRVHHPAVRSAFRITLSSTTTTTAAVRRRLAAGMLHHLCTMISVRAPSPPIAWVSRIAVELLLLLDWRWLFRLSKKSVDGRENFQRIYCIPSVADTLCFCYFCRSQLHINKRKAGRSNHDRVGSNHAKKRMVRQQPPRDMEKRERKKE